jgi:polysaccharide deacetylase 2 family uncharacterized protein YibQ
LRNILVLSILALPLAILYLLPLSGKRVSVNRPPFENFSPAPRTPAGSTRPHARPHAGFKAPMLAILIDDMGYDIRLDRKFIDIEAPLSFAFLPFAPNTGEVAGYAIKCRKDVLVHIPMEPENKKLNPGPGVLTLKLDFDHLLQSLKADIDAVPGAVGANNHMGSRFTKNRKAMETVLAYLKDRGYFFIDSRTTKDTVAFDVARELGLPCARRSVFLDHTLSWKAIRHEIKRSLKLAKERGSVIAIGHPSRLMYQVLYQEMPLIRKEVRLVPVHRLVH